MYIKIKKFSIMIFAAGLLVCCIEKYLFAMPAKPYEKITDAGYSRLAEISGEFLGFPYDGAGIKCDETAEKIPELSEIKSLDCMTYVTTVLAIYQSEINDKKCRGNFTDNLRQIRYKDGKNTCLNRNHFFIADWIGNNPFFSFADITRNIFPAAKMEQKKITLNRRAWFEKNHSLQADFSSQDMTIKYIPFSEILKHDKRDLIEALDAASIIAVVGKKLPYDILKYGSDIDVTHVAFLINTGKNLISRHARNIRQGTLEEDFFSHMERLEKNPYLAGIIVYRIENKKL